MPDRVSLEFLATRVAALQEGLRDLRESQESLIERVEAVENSLTNLGNHVLRHLTLHDRRVARVERRLDAMTVRLERIEEGQFRLADMLSDVLTRLPPHPAP